MNECLWPYRLPVKIAAIVLACLLAVVGLFLVGASGVSIVLAGSEGTTEVAQKAVAEYFLSRYDWEIARDFIQSNGNKPEPIFKDMPYTYTITDETGHILVTNYDGGPYFATSQDVYSYGVGNDKEGYMNRWVTITLYTAPLEAMEGDSWLELGVRTVGHWHARRWTYLSLGILCWVLLLAATVYLYCVAGRRYGQPEAQCNTVDRISFDVYTALYIGGGVLLWQGLQALAHIQHRLILLLALAVFASCGFFLLFGFTMSLATRLKTRTLWSNTVIARLLRVAARGLTAMGRHLPLVVKTLLVLAAVSAVELAVLLACAWEPDVLLIWWLLGKAIEVPAVLLVALGLGRLKNGIHRVATGHTEHQIATAYLPGDLRRTAEDINHIRDGMNDALEDRLKSERFKTELITNVSHDIKTPLTCIINYVDLMEKQNPEDPVLREYLEVLQRQSARLKKLIEDLMEASKASTGNLVVNPEPCQLGVLLEQTVGEYTEKAAANELTLLLHRPDAPVTVLADGRHLWRVLDNLLNNICKYAMPGTRVYLDLIPGADAATITFRNISRTPLYLTSEELTERFVRGDSSRNTEGSGLGLSIARSLMELQGGSLEITVDGDLFKVTLRLPLLQTED